MTQEEFDNFMSEEYGCSITIKRHMRYKCISTWEPDWESGFCLLEDNVTIAGNNNHPHARPKHYIPETRITPEVMMKIKNAITQIIKEENIKVE